MIDWELVEKRLREYLNRVEKGANSNENGGSYFVHPDLKSVLNHLYHIRMLPPRILAIIAKYECTGSSILKKMTMLGLKNRSSGGANNCSKIQLTAEECRNKKYAVLAVEKGVDRRTISCHCKRLIGIKKLKGRTERTRINYSCHSFSR